MNQGLAAIDWLVLAAYAGLTLWLGWYYGRRQSSTKEYFIGGGRLNPIAVGVSLFATLVSTVSYLSVPGETLGGVRCCWSSSSGSPSSISSSPTASFRST